MKDILKKTLQTYFKLEDFRAGQREIIKHIYEGNNTLVFMPTGGGKSLTYQLPGLLREGLAIVISPLISLMKDQVDTLKSLNIPAEFLNSTQSIYEQEAIFSRLHTVKFLYIAPERLGSRDFLSALNGQKISLVAIDEAHCISQWGHDFRPSYMRIHTFIQSLQKTSPNFPIVGLTATATEKVRKDIVERLGLTKYQSFISGFDRKNICIIVRELSTREEKQEKVREIIEKTPGVGIVYCSSRKHVIELSQYLISKNIKTGIYKGDLGALEREREQNAFMNDEYKVIVATNAFGMGIDKKDIRFVVHYNLPGSIENYYQEIGRAGRDGKMSYAVVLASYGDTKIQEFFIENTYPTKQEVLKLYNYLYKEHQLGAGSGTTIQKTYLIIASESGLGNDMKVGSALKILEKYDIIERGMSEQGDENFRGKGITLKQNKKRESEIGIDFGKQSKLEEEAYFKLSQIKELLFYPRCRKRFILEYFGDTEDLATLPINCGLCDFCLESKNISSEDVKKYLPLSSYEVILETIKKYNEQFGQALITRMLVGSGDARLTSWGLVYYEYYGALKDLGREVVGKMIEALLRENYLIKTEGKYPVLSITLSGSSALKREKYLQERLGDLNRYVMQKVSAKTQKTSKTPHSRQISHSKNTTQHETLRLFQEGLSLEAIADKRELGVSTIESHIIDLYNLGELKLAEVLHLSEFAVLKLTKKYATQEEMKLRDIKDLLQSDGYPEVRYFDIKLGLAMCQKGDL